MLGSFPINPNAPDLPWTLCLSSVFIDVHPWFIPLGAYPGSSPSIANIHGVYSGGTSAWNFIRSPLSG